MTDNTLMLKYARLFGTYMGVFWILKFSLFPLGLANEFLLIAFAVLTLCVPYLGYRYLRMYRDQVLSGSINFLQGWLFVLGVYCFAALLTAVAHRYIDQGYILSTYEAMLQALSATDVPGMEAYTNQLNQVLAQLRTLTPIDITMQLLSQNIFYGSLLAVPTALLAVRRPRSNESIKN